MWRDCDNKCWRWITIRSGPLSIIDRPVHWSHGLGAQAAKRAIKCGVSTISLLWAKQMASANSVQFGKLGLFGLKCTGAVPLGIPDMMTSSNGNIFRDTGPLCGEFTGHRWIPLTKASDADLWCFLCPAPEQTVQQTIETLVICNAITLIMTWFETPSCSLWRHWLPHSQFTSCRISAHDLFKSGGGPVVSDPGGTLPTPFCSQVRLKEKLICL